MLVVTEEERRGGGGVRGKRSAERIERIEQPFERRPHYVNGGVADDVEEVGEGRRLRRGRRQRRCGRWRGGR